jgi:hypothetical protein
MSQIDRKFPAIKSRLVEIWTTIVFLTRANTQTLKDFSSSSGRRVVYPCIENLSSLSSALESVSVRNKVSAFNLLSKIISSNSLMIRPRLMFHLLIRNTVFILALTPVVGVTIGFDFLGCVNIFWLFCLLFDLVPLVAPVIFRGVPCSGLILG